MKDATEMTNLKKPESPAADVAKAKKAEEVAAQKAEADAKLSEERKAQAKKDALFWTGGAVLALAVGIIGLIGSQSTALGAVGVIGKGLLFALGGTGIGAALGIVAMLVSLFVMPRFFAAFRGFKVTTSKWAAFFKEFFKNALIGFATFAFSFWLMPLILPAIGITFLSGVGGEGVLGILMSIVMPIASSAGTFLVKMYRSPTIDPVKKDPVRFLEGAIGLGLLVFAGISAALGLVSPALMIAAICVGGVTLFGLPTTAYRAAVDLNARKSVDPASIADANPVGPLTVPSAQALQSPPVDKAASVTAPAADTTAASTATVTPTKAAPTSTTTAPAWASGSAVTASTASPTATAADPAAAAPTASATPSSSVT